MNSIAYRHTRKRSSGQYSQRRYTALAIPALVYIDEWPLDLYKIFSARGLQRSVLPFTNKLRSVCDSTFQSYSANIVICLFVCGQITLILHEIISCKTNFLLYAQPAMRSLWFTIFYLNAYASKLKIFKNIGGKFVCKAFF